MSKDAKIGFVSVLLVMAGLLLYNFKDRTSELLFDDEIGLLFTQVHGLRAGDPVTVGGAPSGRVVEIDFAPASIQQALMPITGGVTLVRAKISLDSFRKIPKESTYTVRTDLNGRRWIDITVSPSTEEIGADDTFFAEQAPLNSDQLHLTIKAFKTLGSQTQELRDELSDPAFRLKTKDTASNLRFYSRELIAVSAGAPAQLKEMGKSLDAQEAAIYAQIEAFEEKRKEVSRRVTEMAPQLSENLQGWTKRMERQGSKLTETLELAIEQSEEYQQMLDELVVKQLDPEVIKQAVVQTRKWARKIQGYRYLAEDLHSLTSDPAVKKELKQVISDLRLKSDEIQKKLLKLEDLVNKNPVTELLGPVRDE